VSARELVPVASLAAVAGALAVVAHPLAPLALAFGLAFVVVAARSAFVALVAFIVVLFTRPADFLPALAVLQPAKMLALGSLGVFALSKVLRRDVGFARLAYNPWMAALTFAVFASGFIGTSPSESLAQATDVFVKIVILYVLITNLVDSERRARALQLSISMLCAGLGGYALWAKVSGNATVEGSRAALVGLLGDPNDLALTILMATPFLFTATLESRGAKRVFFGTSAFLALGGVVSTLSRGGLLGLFSATYLLLRSYGVSRTKIGVALMVAAVPVVAASGLTERASGAVGGDEIDESAQGRLDAWKAGGRMVMRRPVLGVGFGRFPDNFDAYSSNPVFWGRHETHNSYIKAVSETGLLGFVPFMALIVLAVVDARRLEREGRPSPRGLGRALRLGMLPNLAGFLVSAFFLSQCWGWFLYILVAQVAATSRALRLAPDPRSVEGRDDDESRR
jgi:O-antigen ligase